MGHVSPPKNQEPYVYGGKPKLPFARSALDDIMHPASTLMAKAQKKRNKGRDSRKSPSPLSSARHSNDQQEWMEYEEQTEEA